MDSQVKERLVGAAVLVALGVWLIPIVLDGPDEPGASNPAADGASLELPAADESGAPIRTETVELDSSTRRTVTPPPRSG
ncbi:MAG: hypothetical protein R3305_00470, partial [Gammaproteobacteria bacterium]|nr:hypothetical protein [Gammaproteobacteria bacterium]